MLHLGTRVLFQGQEAMVVARTLAGEPTYDLRLPDGSVVKYVREADLELLPEGRGTRPPGSAS